MFQIKRVNLFVFSIISIILIVFDVYKASHASFTIDESDSYLHWVKGSFMDIISYVPAGTNNHILNSLLMKLSEALFGTSELALRLPNIIAHVFYLSFSFKIFDKYANKSYVILFFILMNANPFLIDFFSLARGYGIAIALMTGGFYFYCRYIEYQKNKYHALSMMLFCLAAIANFALISLVLVAVFVHNILQLFVFKCKFSFKSLWKVNYINLIFLFLLTSICYEPIRKIMLLKLLYFGGADGFWVNTVGSIAETFSYFQSYQSFIMVGGKVLVIIFSFLFVIRFLQYLFGKNSINLTQKITLFIGLSLFSIVLVSVLQHFFLQTPFMEERFALFLYPIFILMCSFLFADLLEFSYKYVTRGALILLSFLFFIHTCYSLNTEWYYKWSVERSTKDIMDDVGKIKQKDPSAKIILGGYWEFFSTLEFYVKVRKWDWITLDNVQDVMHENEYFVFQERFFKPLDQSHWEVIQYYPPANSYLVKYLVNPKPTTH